MARRLLKVAPEAPGRRGGVYIYRHLVAEMLQLERVVSGARSWSASRLGGSAAGPLPWWHSRGRC